MHDILFGNNNRPVIKKLSERYFEANKSRNLIAIIAIILTTTLFTTIFTLGSGLLDTIQNQNIRKAGGDGQAVLNYINDEIYNNIQGNPLIDRIAYTKMVSYHIKNPGLEKWRSDMWYMDDTALEFARYEPTAGKKPEAEKEVIADTKTLEALGIPAQIGATVPLTYEIKGKEYTTDFVLCGFWETDSLSNIGRIIVSKAFLNRHMDILTYTYPIDNDYSGIVAAYILFRGGGDLTEKLNQLLSQTGYTCDTMGGSTEDENYIIARISPAYQNRNLFENPAMLISGISGILLIIVTGYLIIYNIFQISVIQDIQSYGQLKTLGATKRQIQKLINRQAFKLSIIGIPFGLMIGFLIGRTLVPFLMNATTFTTDDGIRVTANPLIFIGSAVFALFTVFVSVRKPAKIAGMIGPVEAIRYTGNDTFAVSKAKKSDKKSIHGAKIHRMALANLSRNRKRTILVILSMSLSLVLFNTVFTLSSGFDIEKYVLKFLNKDFVISSADYFNYSFGRNGIYLSESFIRAVQQQSSYQDGGRLYTANVLEEQYSAETDAVTNYNKDEYGNPLVDLYGADDFLLNEMEVIEGEIDRDALKTGKYVLYALTMEENGTLMDNPAIQTGDKIYFHHWKKKGFNGTLENSFDLTVMAKVLIHENSDTTRNTGAARFYLPTEQFIPLCINPYLVSFSFDVKNEAETEMNRFLNSYTENIEQNMNFESKATYIHSFYSMTSLIVTIGGVLSILIGFIGIVNFVNSVLTGIITRRKEFAMLQSIGMTGRQLKRVLVYEGLYYAIGTIVVSFLSGTVFSVMIVQSITNEIWFFTYKFVVWPMFAVYPFLIVLTAAIPAILCKQIAKVSIIERLHQNEGRF